MPKASEAIAINSPVAWLARLKLALTAISRAAALTRRSVAPALPASNTAIGVKKVINTDQIAALDDNKVLSLPH
jgi:hypothetical protein